MPTFEFDRYVDGVLMAEGVCVEKQPDLPSAMRVAAKLAARGKNGETPVLVLRPVSDEAVEAAARRIAKLFGDPDYCVEGSGSTGGDFTCTKRAWQTFIPHARAALAHTGKPTVKPLSWEKHDIDGTLWTSEITVTGEYRVRHGSRGWEAFRNAVKIGEFGACDEAKAAAFTDYEARIRSALQTGGET